MADLIKIGVTQYVEVDREELQGIPGPPGNSTLICPKWLPILSFNGFDVALGYTSQKGTCRELVSPLGGVMHAWGQIQFNGVIDVPAAEVVKRVQRIATPLMLSLPKPIAGALGVDTIGHVGYVSNKHPTDSTHDEVPAYAIRGGGGNAVCYIDSLPKGGDNPLPLWLGDLNPHTQLNFYLCYPTDSTQ